MSSTNSSNSPQIQNELDNFTKQNQDLLNQRAILDTQLLQLLSLPTQDNDSKTKIININAQIASISVQINNLKLQESAVVSSIPSENITNNTVKEQLLQSILITTPLPPKGNLVVVHPNINPKDLITYMTLTQHLNPYGRKRQCDTDLENLMAIINNDVNNSLGENTELLNNIKTLSS